MSGCMCVCLCLARHKKEVTRCTNEATTKQAFQCSPSTVVIVTMVLLFDTLMRARARSSLESNTACPFRLHYQKRTVAEVQKEKGGEPHTHTHKVAPAHTVAPTHTYTNTHKHTQTHTNTHKHKHTHKHTHTHTQTQTHKHTNKCTHKNARHQRSNKGH